MTVEKAVDGELDAQNQQSYRADAQRDAGQNGAPPERQTQQSYQYAGPPQNGQGKTLEPGTAVQVDGDQPNIDPNRSHIQSESEKQRQAGKNHGQHEPYPQHGRRTNHIKAPQPGGQ